MTCPSQLGTKRRINYSNRNQKSTYYFESILTLCILILLNIFIIQLFAIFSRCILSESMFGFNGILQNQGIDEKINFNNELDKPNN
jgi:hypothetical protein